MVDSGQKGVRDEEQHKRGQFIKTNNIGMLNKKFSDLFMRKEAKKEEPKKIPSFDESYFTCKIASNGLNTDLIKIQTEIKSTGMPLDQIKCKWYIKNTNDFRQIQGLVSSYYQPCLDDVGSIICVQIEPFIEGKRYDGITLMEETQIIQLDNQLENQLQKFLAERTISFDAKVEAIYSQNQKFQHIELPLEVKIKVTQSTITFINGETVLEETKINQDFPLIEFIRKTFNSILFNYNDKESMKLSLINNVNRDLFSLIVRTCAAHSHSHPEGINPEIEVEEVKVEQQPLSEEHQITEEDKNPQSDSSDGKSNPISPIVSSAESFEGTSKSSKDIQSPKKGDEAKHKSTLFVLKLDEVNKQLKTLKRKYELLEQNYKLEKLGKCQAQTELQTIKKLAQSMRKERDDALVIARKVRQLKQDNRFYKNEIFIIKKDWKEEKEKRSALERNLQQLQNDHNKEMQNALSTLHKQCENLKHSKQQSDRQRDDLQSEMEKLREEMQKYQNESHNLKKKLESLAHEKGIDKMANVRNRKPSKNMDSQSQIKELEMKIKSLQMLVKYKSCHGDSSSGFQLLVHNLTQTIAEKELQIEQFKKINKNLLIQLNEARQKNK